MKLPSSLTAALEEYLLLAQVHGCALSHAGSGTPKTSYAPICITKRQKNTFSFGFIFPFTRFFNSLIS